MENGCFAKRSTNLRKTQFTQVKLCNITQLAILISAAGGSQKRVSEKVTELWYIKKRVLVACWVAASFSHKSFIILSRWTSRLGAPFFLQGRSQHWFFSEQFVGAEKLHTKWLEGLKRSSSSNGYVRTYNVYLQPPYIEQCWD